MIFFCIGEQAIYAILSTMLTTENGLMADVIRIKEKQLVAMEKMMRVAQSDEVMKRCIVETYQTDDMVAWEVNRLLTSSHPQIVRLRNDPAYMEMLRKWKR